MTFTLGAPQIIWIALYVFNIVYATIHHGESRGVYNVWAVIAGSVVGVAILWWGGFF